MGYDRNKVYWCANCMKRVRMKDGEWTHIVPSGFWVHCHRDRKTAAHPMVPGVLGVWNEKRQHA